MADTPVQIAVALDGIDPSERFIAALAELAAAAAGELADEAAETSGFAYDLNPNEVSFKQVSSTVKSWSFGVGRELKTSGDIQTLVIDGDFGPVS